MRAGAAEREFYPQGHREGVYQFTNADGADRGVSIIILNVSPSSAFRLTGFHYWFRTRNVGTLTGLLFSLSIGAQNVWTAELPVAGAAYTDDVVRGAIGFGGAGDLGLFLWNSEPVGAVLPAGLRGGIRIWGYEERVA